MGYEALAGAAGSILSAIVSRQNTDSTNKQNKVIARDTRDWQSNENQLQRDWEERMWNANNAYNTPAAEMQRMREAGLNPFMNGDKAGQGSQLPAAPGMSSSPSVIPMQPYHMPDLGVAFANIMRANAESSNQNAQSMVEAVKAAKDYYDMTGDKDGAMNMITPFIKASQGASFDAGKFMNRLSAQTELAEHEATIKGFEANIQKKFGEQKAQRVIWNMDQEFTESHARVGLDAALSKYYNAHEESIRKKLQPEIDALVAKAYNDFKQGVLAKEKALTESELREYFVARMMIENGMLGMNFQDREAQFVGDTGKRAAMKSKSGQFNRTFQYHMEVNPFFSTIDRINPLQHALQGLGTVPTTGSMNFSYY